MPFRELSRESAQAIVEEVGAIVKQNINMMDCEGRVIASTDSSRVGSIHEIARRMVKKRLSKLYVDSEQATSTVKNGLNLALEYQGEIVGVIGITGPYAEVAGYGQVVKKMVEILIRENAQQGEERMRRRVLARFLEDWVLGDGLMQPETLRERGFELGIDMDQPRRIMVLSPLKLEEYGTGEQGQSLLEQAERQAERLSGAGSLVLRSGGRQIFLVPWMSNEKLGKIAEKICGSVEKDMGISMTAGIDGGAKDLRIACSQAETAWRSARNSRKNILTYDEVTLELISGELPERVKQEYVGKVFKKCSYEELCRWMGLLEMYFQCDGSLLRTAKALHIHKNTLTHKLHRLEELTGYDVRLPGQSAVFYMAMLFFRDRKESAEQ